MTDGANFPLDINIAIANLVVEAKECMAGAKSKQVEAGQKWLAIKDLLLERNGPSYTIEVDRRGKRAPIGWYSFLKDQGCEPRAVSKLIRFALDPDGMVVKDRKNSMRYKHTPNGATVSFRKAWPTWTQEQREEAIGLIRKAMGAS
jgi:hypothetical protein